MAGAHRRPLPRGDGPPVADEVRAQGVALLGGKERGRPEHLQHGDALRLGAALGAVVGLEGGEGDEREENGEGRADDGDHRRTAGRLEQQRSADPAARDRQQEHREGGGAHDDRDRERHVHPASFSSRVRTGLEHLAQAGRRRV